MLDKKTSQIMDYDGSVSVSLELEVVLNYSMPPDTIASGYCIFLPLFPRS